MENNCRAETVGPLSDGEPLQNELDVKDKWLEKKFNTSWKASLYECWGSYFGQMRAGMAVFSFQEMNNVTWIIILERVETEVIDDCQLFSTPVD